MIIKKLSFDLSPTPLLSLLITIKKVKSSGLSLVKPLPGRSLDDCVVTLKSYI